MSAVKILHNKIGIRNILSVWLILKLSVTASGEKSR